MKSTENSGVSSGRLRHTVVLAAIAAGLLMITMVAYLLLRTNNSGEVAQQKVTYSVVFDESVNDAEKAQFEAEIGRRSIEIAQNYTVSSQIIPAIDVQSNLVVDAYVPVTTFGAVRQQVTTAELMSSAGQIYVDQSVSTEAQRAVAEVLGTELVPLALSELADSDIMFVSVDSLNFTHKLLEFDGSYYLDEFNSGALFRTLTVAGDDTGLFDQIVLTDFAEDGDVYTVNMTGVTALTRVMQRKLASVQDPLYFSALIGDFLADADYTHVSNEVSFLDNCSYSNTSFCSPPEFIETLKASGVDLVELTGNHNNDRGAAANTATIELYDSLGWDTVGGGLNAEDAAVAVLKTAKGSDLAFLAYNYPDSPNGAAIARAETAGANSFDFTRIGKDIAAAKVTSQYVIVSVQYFECYSYPNGYLEFPICDKPIEGQEEDFKKIIDLGADMVVGSSAHQPQTYELYNGKPIYYGLGNLYFDQTSWPGTERGIVLTHYFSDGNLLQTKLSPTVFDRDLQTRLMTDAEAEYLLQRLYDAR